MNITIQQRLPILIFCIFLLYTFKPSIIFKPNGNVRNHGFGYDEDNHKKTLYTFHFVIIIIVFLLQLIR